jgi:hypothetical protein
VPPPGAELGASGADDDTGRWPPSTASAGDEDDDGTGFPEGDDTWGSSGKFDTDGESSGAPIPMPPDLGECSDDSECSYEDDGGCYETSGTCELGSCRFDPKADGTRCDDLSECSQNDTCDGTGLCIGQPVVCTFPHATGVCGDEGCGGPLECADGWADCNGAPSDGCEVELGTTANCSACGDACGGGANVASASCNAGACAIVCDSPWEDCDDDHENGCEIPVGVPNSCDADGLNPAGCWTAHCGSSNHVDARNFGTWFCFECTNCTEMGAGNVAWCSHSSGLWFPSEAGSCVVDGVDYTDLVCAP